MGARQGKKRSFGAFRVLDVARRHSGQKGGKNKLLKLAA
jgi:hypothetical protein